MAEPGPVRLNGLGVALPPHVLTQADVLARARALLSPRFPGFERIAPAFLNAGITQRHSVVPLDWFGEGHGWQSRSAAHLAGATALFEIAATRALAEAGIEPPQIDAVVTVCSTGVLTPTLEARVALGLRPDVLRLPVFGLGCAGGVSGLSVARELAAAAPGRRVLMVAIETCTLLFRMDRLAKADIIATALFGDGAAAAVVSTAGDGPVLGAGRQHKWPDTLGVMGWEVLDDGLGVIFDRAIPDFAAEHLRPAMDAALRDIAAVDRFVCHPGGAKVITALETALDLPEGSLDAEREVLEACGNMSGPTVLFVLDRILRRGARGRMMLAALGPGFTLSLLPLDAA
ncbi:type III polyketide synthase [Paracoccus sp. S-4012]|uniref:type III polyketide synthase n=1 Tax=Paracoccus sp. S-4012 TaxID=2665648 RepID=UPI0012AFB528|nr:type III polyketide synthase [Paracoccus sp. S-4012]MRX49351.1 type III polyketide synthase [Paracoccus sp. S-4012]